MLSDTGGNVGRPTWVELTNIGGTTVDLSMYSVGFFSNANTTLNSSSDPSLALSGMLAPGDSFVIGIENEDQAAPSFFSVYDNLADAYIGTNGPPNGDDTFVLFMGVATGDATDATVVDIFGSVGTDGTGEGWEYLDSYACRLASTTAANTVWTASEWFNAPANTLDGNDTESAASKLLRLTTPFSSACDVDADLGDVEDVDEDTTPIPAGR